MTYSRKVIVLGSLAAALLVLYVAGLVFSPQRLDRASSEAVLFPAFSERAAEKIELASGTSRVILARGDAWAIDIDGRRFPASQARVSGLLSEIKALPRGTLVTRSPDKAAGLGVSGPEAIHLTVTGANGKTLCGIVFGKTPPTGRGRYIQAAGSNDVYETADALSAYASAERKYWADLKVFPSGTSADKVIKLVVRGSFAFSGGKDVRKLDYTLVREQDKNGKTAWSFAAGEKAFAGRQAAEDKVKGVLESILSFEGIDFEMAPESAGKLAADPKAVIQLSLSDNRELTLFVGSRAEGDQYPCALQGGAFSYLLPEWRVSQAFATPESLASGQR